MTTRTYDVLDADNNLVGQQELDESMAPSLLHGQKAVLTHLNGEKLVKASRVVLGDPGTGGADAPRTPEELRTEAEAAAEKAARKADKAAEKAGDAAKPA